MQQHKNNISNTFSENSCAKKMCHLLLAGYADVPSFLNQWKVKRSLILFFEDIFYKAGGALN